MEPDYSAEKVLSQVTDYLTPAIEDAADESLVSRGDSNVTFLAVKPSSDVLKSFKAAAGALRAQARFVLVQSGAAADTVRALTVDGDETWDGVGDLAAWIKPRTLPLVADYDYSLLKRYEAAGLPLAKLWVDERGETPEVAGAKAREIVAAAAKEL